MGLQKGQAWGGEQSRKTPWRECQEPALARFAGQELTGRHREDAEGVPQDLHHQVTNGPLAPKVCNVFRPQQTGGR